MGFDFLKENSLFATFFTRCLGALIGSSLWLPSIYAATLYPFEDSKQTAQFQHLIADLRCPVCQNQNIADSNAPLAKTLRQEVYRSVLAGQSDDEIMHDMTARYGDYIVFNPPVKALTLLLWLGPVMFLLLGILIFYVTCIKKPKRRT